MAALYAVMFGKERGLVDIIFEEDALQIVDAVNSPV